ncbi:MAG: GntG family PLP-dependent aldolase [Chloroflexi bacterium]|nr:GntG family PLP-dependent aldolase [Chloroflexota bacterium]MDA1239771.1 GntG family PLP-dependent aldolase [Chloroflexota bacterium]MQC25417.1 aminotransferase class I/II-fold pyridoxal phosphate-dependent enzyme [Chloroflexota bacterium]MQC48107.1 aminotransferase class I/II-fold pyridoxal phosphate-dependent enzyme [Chloroflexota bacterium]
MDVIDLRSDTVTRPSAGMREAMARAEVGDDMLGEDPSVHALEEAAAARIGKEAALYVPSGTMANLVALLTHCGRGEEAIAGSESHILNHEGMGASVLGSIPVRAARNDERGRIDPAEVRSLIRDSWPKTSVVCLENTHNRCGGAALTASEMRSVADVAHERGLSVHVDGARIFNAAAALETTAAALVAEADTVSFCFSKGLGAPVGSVITGPREFIDRARHNRRLLGGAMRQSGMIASAALYALEHNVERLAEDHANARRLADAIATMPHVRMDPAGTDTNIVFFTLEGVDGAEFRRRLAEEGVLCTGTSVQRVRMVCHMDVTAAQIEAAIPRIRAVLESLTAAS